VPESRSAVLGKVERLVCSGCGCCRPVESTVTTNRRHMNESGYTWLGSLRLSVAVVAPLTVSLSHQQVLAMLMFAVRLLCPRHQSVRCSIGAGSVNGGGAEVYGVISRPTGWRKRSSSSAAAPGGGGGGAIMYEGFKELSSWPKRSASTALAFGEPTGVAPWRLRLKECRNEFKAIDSATIAKAFVMAYRIAGKVIEHTGGNEFLRTDDTHLGCRRDFIDTEFGIQPVHDCLDHHKGPHLRGGVEGKESHEDF
jgi:hypothetical protein